MNRKYTLFTNEITAHVAPFVPHTRKKKTVPDGLPAHPRGGGHGGGRREALLPQQTDSRRPAPPSRLRRRGRQQLELVGWRRGPKQPRLFPPQETPAIKEGRKRCREAGVKSGGGVVGDAEGWGGRRGERARGGGSEGIVARRSRIFGEPRGRALRRRGRRQSSCWGRSPVSWRCRVQGHHAEASEGSGVGLGYDDVS